MKRVAQILAFVALTVTMAACSSATTTTRTSDQTRTSWTTKTFHGDGLAVSFSLPRAWQPQLPGQSFHYYDIMSFVGNFPLNHRWCTSTPTSETCTWRKVGIFPPGGVLMTFGATGYMPGAKPTLGPGTTTTLDGRRARRSTSHGGCLGVGATDSVGYVVSDGKSQGEFDIEFCFRGAGTTAFERMADQVAHSLRIAPDPTNQGVFP